MFRIKLVADSGGKTHYELAIKVPFARCRTTSYRVLISSLTKKEILDFVKDVNRDAYELQDDLESEIKYLDSEEGNQDDKDD